MGLTPQWSDQQGGQTMFFRIHRLQFLPHLPADGTVKFYIYPGNPTRYHMDL